jgi:hypothetical protein
MLTVDYVSKENIQKEDLKKTVSESYLIIGMQSTRYTNE